MIPLFQGRGFYLSPKIIEKQLGLLGEHYSTGQSQILNINA